MRVNPPFSAVWKWLASFAGVRLAFWWRVNGVEIGGDGNSRLLHFNEKLEALADVETVVGSLAGACPTPQKKCFGFVRSAVPLEAAPACTATIATAASAAARRTVLRFIDLAPFV